MTRKKKYTVALLYPDHIDTEGPQIYTAWVWAVDRDAAIVDAKVCAGDESMIELLVWRGHTKFE